MMVIGAVDVLLCIPTVFNLAPAPLLLFKFS